MIGIKMQYIVRFFGLMLVGILLVSCGSSRITNVRKTGNNHKQIKVTTTKDATRATAIFREEPMVNSESIILKNVPDQFLDRTTIEIQSIIIAASQYLGTPYRFGGTDVKGMDCSGLVIRSFEAVEMSMPRISRDQASKGKQISLNDIKIGDLLFFNTSGSSISHVGIVESVKDGIVYFIHASTSKGVMVSSLAENYWSRRFVKATRML